MKGDKHPDMVEIEEWKQIKDLAEEQIQFYLMPAGLRENSALEKDNT